jgi:hypothetical protein
MTISAATVARFVNELEIFEPIFERGEEGLPPPDTVTGALDGARNQATVVGSDVLSFVKGVTAEGREAIVNSSLLAQLAAKKKVPDSRNIDAWYEAYFDTLTNLGWVIQSKDFADYEQRTDNFEAHQAVLTLVTALLGGAAPTALRLVISALEALHSMDEGRPWITIFNREAQNAQTGRFQISLVEPGSSDDFLVSMIALSMRAESTITQVLFFKARKDEVKLRHDSSKVTIAASALVGALPTLRARLARHVASYVSMVEI